MIHMFQPDSFVFGYEEWLLSLVTNATNLTGYKDAIDRGSAFTDLSLLRPIWSSKARL